MSSINRKFARSQSSLTRRADYANNSAAAATAPGYSVADLQREIVARKSDQAHAKTETTASSLAAPQEKPLTAAQETRMLIKQLEAIIGPPQPPPPSTADITSVSNVKPEEVSWLFKDWIPAGKVSVIIGEPGLGKSLITLDIAARLSTGREMPTLTPSPEPLAPKHVLLFSMEDNVADTIRPRLEAAGADLSRIHLFPNGGQRQFIDYRSLISLIKELSASLVIVDPLSAYLGSKHISSDQQIRELFADLAVIARHFGTTFLIVHHPNKGRSGTAVMRSAGSLAVTAAARSVMLIAKDLEDPSRRILALVKGNLGPPPPARSLCIDQERGVSHPHIRWAGAAKAVTADTLVLRTGREERAQISAERFLRETLADGPMPSKDLEELALAQGHSRGVFSRAKMAVTRSTRTGGIGAAGTWQTSLK